MGPMKEKQLCPAAESQGSSAPGTRWCPREGFMSQNSGLGEHRLPHRKPLPWPQPSQHLSSVLHGAAVMKSPGPGPLLLSPSKSSRKSCFMKLCLLRDAPTACQVHQCHPVMATLSKEGLSASRPLVLEAQTKPVSQGGPGVGRGLTDAPQPDDADGALHEAVATQPQGLPRGPATTAGRRRGE